MKLIIKSIESFDNILLEGNIKLLKIWFDSAASEDIAVAYNKLATYIFHMCGAEANIELAYPQIEKFNPIMHQAITLLIQRYLTQGEFLSRENECIANACKKMLKVQYRAYSMLLDNARQSNEKRVLLVTSIHQIITIQLYIHIISYITYNAIPDKEWLNLHRLFRIAEKNNLTDFSVKYENCYIENEISICDLYIDALLLGCANLHTLNVEYIIKVLNFVFERSHLVTIVPESQGLENEIAVDITTGSAPNFRQFLVEKNGSEFRYIYVEKLLVSMKKLITTNNVFNRSGLTDDLKKHLMKAWGRQYNREKRINVNKSIEVTIGFSNIHYYLCGGKEFKGFVGARADLSVLYEADELVSVIEQQRSSDVWSPGISEPAGELVHVELPERLEFQRYFEIGDNVDNVTHPKFTACMLDQSLHGCCLDLQKEQLFDITIGNLIGFRDPDMNSHWQIGEIVWFKLIAGNMVRLGIRLIGTESIPLGIDIPLKYGVNRNYTKGILLPFENTLKLCTGILTEETFFDEGECLKVAQKGLAKDMKLTSRINHKEYYTHFYCGFYLP